MEPDLLVCDVAIRVAKISLRMTGAMAQWHKHLACAQRRLRHILAYDRITARKSFLGSQSLENPMRRVALLLVNCAVVFEDLVDPRHVWTELLRVRRSRRL
jgi:hypothetical protein